MPIRLAYTVACLWSFQPHLQLLVVSDQVVSMSCAWSCILCPRHQAVWHVGVLIIRHIASISKALHEAHTAVAFCCGGCIMLVFCPALLHGRVCVSAVLLYLHYIRFSALDGSFVRPSYHEYVWSVSVPFAFLFPHTGLSSPSLCVYHSGILGWRTTHRMLVHAASTQHQQRGQCHA
jgi:hypothetical protein